MAGAFAFSTSGPETFGDFILTHLNPALAFLLNPPVTITASSYAPVAGDGSLIINSTATENLTLPASSLNSGRPLEIKTLGQAVQSVANNVVLIGGTTGQATILAAAAGKWARLKADGTNWVIMAGST